MKRIITCIILLAIQLISAQNRSLRRANLYFERTFYSSAIPLYEKDINTPFFFESASRLADAYYYTKDPENALKWYSLLVKKFESGLQEEHYYRYAQTLKALGQYDKGNAVLRKRIEKEGTEQELSEFDNAVGLLEDIAAIGNRFEIKNLEINTEHSDFGAVKNGADLVFTSNKKSNRWFSKIYKWNNETYLDLYTIPIDQLESGTEYIKPFSKKINTRLHESNAVFTKDGKTVYFTRNSPKHIRDQKTKKKISHLQLYKAEFIDGKWKNIQLLPFNLEGYSTEHPALSEDEKTLYFASDRPGTLGGFDLFSIAVYNNGTFGEPKNLGEPVNTKRNEQFPFVSEDHKLYFSSDGHLGFGGLDVFVSDLQNGSFSKPVNVGLPVNSGYDDFAFNIDSKTKTGYFASDRPEGKGSDDIYSLEEIKPLIPEDCRQWVSGTVTDQDTAQLLENAVVILQNDQDNELERVSTDHEGKYRIPLACAKTYTISVSKEGYIGDFKNFETDRERDKTNMLSFALKSYNQIKEEIQEERKLLEKKRKEEKAFLLQQQKIEEKKEMGAKILLKKEQALAVKKQKEEVKKRKKEQLEQLVVQDKDIIKDKDQYFIKTDPIYFDFDLYYIRKDSRIVLDKVVDIMKKYPGMIIEVRSHTDVRGRHKYNMELSEKRVQETRKYILNKGIEPRRISAKGYGKTMPIILCEPIKSCTEEQHELNRRTEFIIKEL